MNDNEQNNNQPLDPITRLTRDLREAASTLGRDEARYLVDAYYQIQGNRITSANQVRSLSKSEEPHMVVRWLMDQNQTLENQIKRALDRWTDVAPASVWSKTITGIGPVLSAGLAAHIDITKAPTVGHIWSFAGLNPTVEWKKGEKRPWNASLKVLCWKIGESFVKVSSNPKDFYGKLYLDRKDLEIKRNDQHLFADQAEAKLKKFKIGKDTDAYKAYSSGLLPPAHIHARACRYAVKLFLSHYHHVAYVTEYHKDPPVPYVMVHGELPEGHVHYMPPPNFPM